ncbi:MAG: thiol reductant ABC exporter subunit CydC, partial [Eggerthella lenta]|nr:thiol reductant ABC exporter subunit CydC [Eggerthella lenta]
RCPDCPAHGRRGEEPAPVEPTRRLHLSVMLRLVGLVRPLAPWMALAVVLGVLGFGAAIFLTVFGVYALVDLAGFPQTVGYGAALALVAVCGVARGPLRYGEQLCNHYLAFKLLALVRDRVFAALRRLAPAKLEGRDKGDLVSLVTGDIELLEVLYAHTLSPAIIAFVVSAGMTAFVATISPALGLLALASYLLVGVAVPYASSKASGMGGRELREGLGGMNAFVLDSLRGLRETLQFGRAAERSRELDERMDELARAEARLKGRGALAMSLTNGLVLALDVAMVLASGTLCLSGAIAPDGALVATAALMSSFGPVIAVANLGSTLQQTLASGGRVLELLDERPQTEEVDDGVDLGTFSGAAVRRVDFSYGGHPVLDDVSLHIEPGSVVHLAGRSGSGKSTLCKLLMRFWDATRGVVEVSGTDVRRANTASLRETQGYMTQETHLFAGTIGENILLAKPSASPEELAEACRKAALSGLIERLPRGLDTPVGELGETLSGGERQRIGLARVFLHDAPFVLLDEPTSNLDSLNEAAVLRALSEGRGDKTVVLVSHRASTAAIADVEYTVDRGRLG